MSTYASYVTGKPDPSLANIGNPAIRGIVAHVLSLLPTPASAAQIKSDVAGQVGAQTQPYLKQLDDAATRRSSEGNAAITGYTNAAQDHLAGTDAIYKDIGSTNAQARAAIMQAVQGGLQGSGAGVTGNLAERLRLMNAGPGFAGDNGALAGNIGGVVASRAALGLDQSLSNTAADRGYAATLPGVLAASGLQSSRLLGEQVNSEHAAGVDRLNAMLPTLIANLTSSATNRSSNQATERARMGGSLLTNLLNLDTQRGIARQSYGLGLGKINASIYGTQTRADTSASNAAAAAGRHSDSAAASARAATLRQIDALVKEQTAMHPVKTQEPVIIGGQRVGSKSVTKSVRAGKYGPTRARADAIADALLGSYLPDEGKGGIDQLVASLVLPSLWGLKPPVKTGRTAASLSPGTR